MKNLQKGFIVPLLLAIIAVLVIGGGIYIFNIKKSEAPVLPDMQTTNQVQQQTNNQNSPVNNQPVTVTLDLSSPFALQYKTILTEAFKKTANFNVHYVVTEIGCGTGCFTFVVIDKNTGKVYPAPVGNDIGQFTGDIGQPYNINSNQIKIIIDNGSKINTYVFSGSSFSLLSSIVTYKIYNDIVFGFSFEYPTNWQVKESFYATPAQQYNGGKGDIVALVVTSPAGKEIAIGGRQAECQPSTSIIKAACFKNIPITTTATDVQSILVFNHLVATLSSKY